MQKKIHKGFVVSLFLISILTGTVTALLIRMAIDKTDTQTTSIADYKQLYEAEPNKEIPENTGLFLLALSQNHIRYRVQLYYMDLLVPFLAWAPLCVHWLPSSCTR